MIQSGTLYTVNSTGNPTNMPIKGAWIRFTQSGVVKAQIQTNKSTGKYSVDVPIGKYVVELAVGSTTSYPRAAQEFELKTADKADTFQNWLYSKAGDVNDALIKSFKAVLDAANLAASNAKQSEINAKAIVENKLDKTIANQTVGTALTVSNKINTSNYVSIILHNARDDQDSHEFGSSIWFEKAANNKYLDIKFRATPYVSGQQNVVRIPSRKGVVAFVEDIKNMSVDNGVGAYKVLTQTEKDGFATGLQFGGDPSSASSSFGRAGAIFKMGGYKAGQFQMHFGIDDQIKFRGGDGVAWRSIYEFFTTKNTTVDSNGFIKKASPIIKLFDDHIEFNDGFKEEPIFEKLATGVYKISNLLGLAKAGWYIDIPIDRNKDAYFNIEWFQSDNNDIAIHVFERLLEQYEKNGKTYLRYVNGEPRDIARNERWIDLRFHEQIDDIVDDVEDVEDQELITQPQ